MRAISDPKAVLRPIVRPVRRALTQTGFHRLEHAAIFHDFESAELGAHFSAIMQRRAPLFVGRIGGSDYDLLPAYYNDSDFYESDKMFGRGVDRVREFNGYFDVENRYENFIKFLDELIAYYKNADCLTYGGPRLVGRFKRNRFKKAEANMLNSICHGKDLINYCFIEYLSPFLRSFQVWGDGLTVLVVSPLAKSVGIQNGRRNQLLRGYRFPDFQLVTYNSNVTYSRQDDTSVTLRVDTNNWHEECAKMAGEIAEIEFDVAFLSCASYSMYLGNFIRNAMGKKALYLGGILSPMFNIYAPRYDFDYFNDLMHLDRQIDPVENANIESLAAGRSTQDEALNAYFGQRPR